MKEKEDEFRKQKQTISSLETEVGDKDKVVEKLEGLKEEMGAQIDEVSKEHRLVPT